MSFVLALFLWIGTFLLLLLAGKYVLLGLIILLGNKDDLHNFGDPCLPNEGFVHHRTKEGL